MRTCGIAIEGQSARGWLFKTIIFQILLAVMKGFVSKGFVSNLQGSGNGLVAAKLVGCANSNMEEASEPEQKHPGSLTFSDLPFIVIHKPALVPGLFEVDLRHLIS